MNGHGFSFHGAELVARPTGALHWPAAGLLAVSDLHLGKALRLARRGGGLLPPYEVTETLTRLQDEIEATAARRVICLGDSFDDPAAAAGLDEGARLWLVRLMAGRDWVWIAGNHDPALPDLPGTRRSVLRLDGLTFRHIAEPGAVAEVSGHYHPKAALAGRSRPCFLLDGARLILPAFGAYTGGLACHDPALTGLMAPGALAILTGPRALPMPMPRQAPGYSRPRATRSAR
ncbi:MAG: ligase-associated DNA damage response endonuclease PdeM [Rhodobacterales bacterium]|nr:ligase-associated DNA damage response endonuclease PdeM [Rhodobacterales bacterium]